jgi:hypothetical protein
MVESQVETLSLLKIVCLDSYLTRGAKTWDSSLEAKDLDLTQVRRHLDSDSGSAGLGKGQTVASLVCRTANLPH